jgi:DNA-binding IclR family transcriptional regulator
VAFLPARASSSFSTIRGARSFCVNVLSAKQEAICRQFAVSGGDKFAGVDWSSAPSGAPILDGVVAWIDCDFDRIDEAGDHYIVLGRVRGLGTGVPTIPLLFFQGGYGGFATTSLAMGASADLMHILPIADRSREELDALAAEVGFECYAQVLKDDRIILAVASGYPALQGVPPSRVGVTLPLVPPWGEAFMAWHPRDEQIAWMDRIRTPTEDRQRMLDEMEAIRSAGWSMTVWRSIANIRRVVDMLNEHGHTPAAERELAQLCTTQAGWVAADDVARIGDYPAGSVASISAPVCGPDGEFKLMVNIYNIAVTTPEVTVQRCIRRLLEATELIAGRLV